MGVWSTVPFHFLYPLFSDFTINIRLIICLYNFSSYIQHYIFFIKIQINIFLCALFITFRWLIISYTLNRYSKNRKMLCNLFIELHIPGRPMFTQFFFVISLRAVWIMPNKWDIKFFLRSIIRFLSWKWIYCIPTLAMQHW